MTDFNEPNKIIISKLKRIIVLIVRQNLTENQAISGFSGQKSGTRILSILQSFLHFFKGKYINNPLK